MAERLKGGTWSATSLPPLPKGATASRLFALSCTAATGGASHCTAVGNTCIAVGKDTAPPAGYTPNLAEQN